MALASGTYVPVSPRPAPATLTEVPPYVPLPDEVATVREALDELTDLCRRHEEIRARQRVPSDPSIGAALREHLRHGRLVTNGCSYCEAMWRVETEVAPASETTVFARPAQNRGLRWLARR